VFTAALQPVLQTVAEEFLRIVQCKGLFCSFWDVSTLSSNMFSGISPRVKMNLAQFPAHDLGNGLQFFEGRLPSQLTWSTEQFADAWSLHPDEKPTIFCTVAR